MNKGYMTTREVCELFRFSRVTLYRMIKRGEFPEPLLRGNGKACKWSIDQIEKFEKKLQNVISRKKQMETD